MMGIESYCKGKYYTLTTTSNLPLKCFYFTSRHKIPVDIQVYYANCDVPVANSHEIYRIEPEELAINTLGVLEVVITFLTLSMHHSNQRFLIKFTLRASYLQRLFPALYGSSSSSGIMHQRSSAVYRKWMRSAIEQKKKKIPQEPDDIDEGS